MTNLAPAPTAGMTDLSVQSSTSAGGRRAKADVVAKSWAAGLESSEEPDRVLRSGVKDTPSPLHHGGKPREQLSRGKASSPRRSEMTVAESRHDFRATPPAPWRLMRILTRTGSGLGYRSSLKMTQSTLSQLGCGEVGMDGEWEKTCFLEKRNCWSGFSASSNDPGPCKVLELELTEVIGSSGCQPGWCTV